MQSDIPLSTLTTMRLGGNARYVYTVLSKSDIESAWHVIKKGGHAWFVLGSGSNVVANGDYSGVVILSTIKGIEIVSEDEYTATIRCAAGEIWDEVVAFSVDHGLSGIEAMSAIPGTAGATPVQNVGAYGQEIADTLTQLEAYDVMEEKWVTLDKTACDFSYRGSIFKNPLHRRYIIASITLRLSKKLMQPPFYASLQSYLNEQHITDTSPSTIRSAVRAIRAIKLPDPSLIPNNGSFFKNPIVPNEKARTLLEKYPSMPQYPLLNGDVKLAAGWLIEQAGFRGYSAHGMKMYEQNALVMINEHASTYAGLLAFKEEVVAGVHEHFGVTLEQEPELLSS